MCKSFVILGCHCSCESAEVWIKVCSPLQKIQLCYFDRNMFDLAAAENITQIFWPDYVRPIVLIERAYQPLSPRLDRKHFAIPGARIQRIKNLVCWLIGTLNWQETESQRDRQTDREHWNTHRKRLNVDFWHQLGVVAISLVSSLLPNATTKQQ